MTIFVALIITNNSTQIQGLKHKKIFTYVTALLTH
jgi:hypothetical protein